MKKLGKQLMYFGLLILFTILSTIINPLSGKISASDADVVKVNGIIIYEAGSYNSSHGISGVLYDTIEKTLNLTSASIESIYANGDLTINITNNNAVDAVTSNIAVEVRGNLNIYGGSNGATLNIMAMSADDRAIEISAGSTLTVGEPSSSDYVTVSINRGRNVNTVDNTIVIAGNTYNYTTPGGGGDPGPGPGPEPSDPLTISIDGITVIDETADSQITSADGDGWNIEQIEAGPGYSYALNIEKDATVGYITGTGDGSLTITGDSNIAENEDGFSINMAGRVNIFGGESDEAGDINLAGGIYTEGLIDTYDRDFTIGSAENPSSKGVVASEVMVSMGNLTIYTTGVGLSYYNEIPAVGDGLIVESRAGRLMKVASSNTATENVSSVRVSGGGRVELNYSVELGTFVKEASHWPWVDMTGTEEENPLPITVECEEGTDTVNKYRLTTTEDKLLLESTAGTLYKLSWNIPGADDSIVTNGTVRVIAANGYRFTSGGYTDYSIEAGTPVTIELLPDYGYQYISGGLNGQQTSPEDGKASYSFIMPSGNLHLSAIFEPKSDIIDIRDDKIDDASIVLPNSAINGNAKLTVSKAADVDEASFVSKSGDKIISGYVDLELDEVIYKGNEEEAWETPITELDNEMTVNLELDKSLQGYSDYSILRNHEGTITELAAEYDAKTGTLSFQTDTFSDYAIIHGERITNPDTYDNIMKYFVLSGFGLIGLITSFVCILRRRKQFNKF